MTYKLIYTDSYLKRATKIFKKHPDIVSQYEKTLKLLEINPEHPSLRLHQLKGKLKGNVSDIRKKALEALINNEEIGGNDEIGYIPADVQQF